jgi:hypothetical protein
MIQVNPEKKKKKNKEEEDTSRRRARRSPCGWGQTQLRTIGPVRVALRLPRVEK